jgi:hypothetical protein
VYQPDPAVARGVSAGPACFEARVEIGLSTVEPDTHFELAISRIGACLSGVSAMAGGDRRRRQGGGEG